MDTLNPNFRAPCSLLSSTDSDGRVVMAVAISNDPGSYACLYIEDFTRLVSEHGLSSFFINTSPGKNPHVLFKSRRERRQIVVARFVTRERKGRFVEALDGNLLNLRSSNLVTRPGGCGGMKRAAPSL